MSSLFHKLHFEQHLKDAWKELDKSNKKSHGLDQITISDFKQSLETEVHNISVQLKENTYQFSKMRGVAIPKPGTDRPRPIQIPAVRDRVVMKAIALLIQPKLRRFDLSCSFAYVPGPNGGTHKAIQRIHELAGHGYRWIVEADISNFFGEVNQERLFKQLFTVVRARSLEHIIKAAVQNEIGNRDSFQPIDRDLFPAATSGIPQGGVLSPMLANLYLSKFDIAATNRGLKLIRYADDFVILCKTREDASAALKFSRSFLMDRLGLKLNEGGLRPKTRIIHYNAGFDFLGFRVSSGSHSPSNKSVQKLKDKITRLLNPRTGEKLFPLLLRLRNILLGWYEAFKDSQLGDIPREINNHVVAVVSKYLSENRFMPMGANLNNRQLHILGIPRLQVRPINKKLGTQGD